MTIKALTKAELREGLVERNSDDHKGVYGHALIVAGSRGMAGAAILAARATLRSGAGLVTVAVPSGVAAIVAGAVPSAMTLPLPENVSGTFRPDGVERLKIYAKDRRVTAVEWMFDGEVSGSPLMLCKNRKRQQGVALNLGNLVPATMENSWC